MTPRLVLRSRAVAAHSRVRKSVRRASGATDAGFTLVELTVALVAGLIVALGIVGLSKEATRTFHEEARSSAAEATLRTAIDRLRADLRRAAYMSTGNIMADPTVARAPTDANNVTGVSAQMAGLRRLAGIHLLDGASAANTSLSAQQQPVLAPDSVDIGGNMTCAEQFEVENVQVVGSCTRITLSATSPAIYRVAAVGPQAQSTELNNLFQPYPGHQFMVRLLDDTGRSQYLATCPGTTTAGFTGAGQPYVDVDQTATRVYYAQDTATLGGVTSTPSGRAFVNPVQVVRWELKNAAQEPAQYRNALDNVSLAPGTLDTTKYDLVRSYVDAAGNVVAETTEVVAEYAVDLDVAFSVENGTVAQPQGLTLAFDDPQNQTWADDVSANITASNRPQRIRSVRIRLATRAAQADRTTNIPVTDYGGQGAATEFMYRYCLVLPCTTPPPADGVLRWARVRTMTTEVRLPNQAGFFY